MLDNVICSEGDNITFANGCTYDATHNCGHSEDIFLTCASGKISYCSYFCIFVLVWWLDNPSRINLFPDFIWKILMNNIPISGEDCSNARATKFKLVTSTGEKSTSGSGLLIATTVRTVSFHGFQDSFLLI